MQRQHHLAGSIRSGQHHHQHHQSKHGADQRATGDAVERSGHHNGDQRQRDGKAAKTDEGGCRLQDYHKCGQHAQCRKAGKSVFHLSNLLLSLRSGRMQRKFDSSIADNGGAVYQSGVKFT